METHSNFIKTIMTTDIETGKHKEMFSTRTQWVFYILVTQERLFKTLSLQNHLTVIPILGLMIRTLKKKKRSLLKPLRC